MIKKEYYKTMEDGVKLYRTYSDTEHKIKRVSDGITYDDAIDVSENVEYEEVDEYIDTEGSYSYEEILEIAEKSEDITRKINQLNLSNNKALSVKGLYPKWEDKIGSTEANSLKGKISNESPVGRALIGAKVGDVVDVETPGGMAQYKVLEIQRSQVK